MIKPRSPARSAFFRPPRAGARLARPGLGPAGPRVIYCGDNLEQLKKLPDQCVDLIGTRSRPVGIDPPFNSNRNDEVFWGETK